MRLARQIWTFSIRMITSSLWVTEFPQFEWSDEQERYLAMHHPFTMPMEEDITVS